MMIYLDNCASTKVYPEVANTVCHLLTENYANPSALHLAGQEAEKVLKLGRQQVAFAMGAKAENIVFTSGGTEANNLALFSAFYSPSTKKNKTLLVSSVEHPSVKNVVAKLKEDGVKVLEIPVLKIDSGSPGAIDTKAFMELLDDSTGLVSIMHVNNEIGTIQPVLEVSEAVRALGGKSASVQIHTDAVQSFGKLPINVNSDDFRNIDFISLSAHKLHGPKGIGALYSSNPKKLHPIMYGGGQEGGIRSGTENVPGVAGFGLAAEMTMAKLESNAKHASVCRSRLLEGIVSEIPDISVNSPVEASITGEPYYCSPYLLNVSFLGTIGEVILHELEKSEIFVSTGSACSSLSKGGKGGRSVHAQIGLGGKATAGAIRFSFSHYNTIEEMDITIEALKKAVSRFRKIGTMR